MQALIWIVAGGLFIYSHVFAVAGIFFVAMQFGAVAGALWGNRLREKILRADGLSARGS